jgi:hypothetical protein
VLTIEVSPEDFTLVTNDAAAGNDIVYHDAVAHAIKAEYFSQFDTGLVKV